MQGSAYQFEALSESMLLIRGGSAIDAACNARVHALADRIGAADLPGLIELVPAYASLGLRYDVLHWAGRGHTAFEAIVGALQGLLQESDDNQDAVARSSARQIEIPVCYGGALGVDLPYVARACEMETEAVIRCHSEARYTVAMLGFAPGFPYLIGLDPRLHLARRADPRLQVPAGSVAMGGAQTGIYPRALPGGWHLIGTTPVRLFNADARDPCLLAPGDQVHFRRISEAEFAELKALPE